MSHSRSFKPRVHLLAGILATALLPACGGGGSSGSATGTLNLSVTDAPVDYAEHVWVEFSGVEIKAAGGSVVDIIYDTPRRIDLLALTGGIAEVIVDNQVLPAGQVQWLRLKVNASQGGDPADDSYIVIDGVSYELRIPSGDERGLQLNRPITIPEGGVATFTIDFDLRKSVHARSGGVYHLRPTLRLVDNSTVGALAGTVDAATLAAAGCESGDPAAVYVFEGTVIPDDVDGTDPDPVSTASVDWEAGDTTYTVAFLAAGDYTAAFTCDAGLDDPAASDASVSFTGAAPVTVVAGRTATQDF
ncbi:MAG: DUF4382 domain-containing protein [Gammaproteobacteria bacterium]|nr:DUF4382 domain-containing protein [Gammaproteobacteria bacterium]